MAQARRRLIYQELLLLQLGLRMHRREQRERGAAPVIAVDARLDSRIRARFPFEFTASQRQAVAEITADIAMACPMNRLLQGDVGSGKTAVAIYAMLAAVAAGRQAAIMAPTELLARQHMASLERLLAGSKIGLELLVGGQSAAKREKALARIADGQSQIVVGTQALVVGSATFKALGLVVIDEQHRFGVIQRSQLQQGNVDPADDRPCDPRRPRSVGHEDGPRGPPARADLPRFPGRRGAVVGALPEEAPRGAAGLRRRAGGR
jgi:ATP-dependent DNA helicase RecG